MLCAFNLEICFSLVQCFEYWSRSQNKTQNEIRVSTLLNYLLVSPNKNDVFILKHFKKAAGCLQSRFKKASHPRVASVAITFCHPAYGCDTVIWGGNNSSDLQPLSDCQRSKMRLFLQDRAYASFDCTLEQWHKTLCSFSPPPSKHGRRR